MGGSLWAEAYTPIRRGLYTLYLSSTFLLRRFPHITDVISFVISIVLQYNYRVGMKHGSLSVFTSKETEAPEGQGFP